MRRLHLVSVWFCLALAVAARAYTPAGNITADETWSSATRQDTIRVTGTIYVKDGAILTIQPGTIIRGYQGATPAMYVLYVQGAGVIRALGTAEQPITFKNINVEFTLTTRDSLNLLQYCNFSSPWGHAFIETRNPTEPGEQSGFTADHCTFTGGSYCCIYITSGGNPTITNCIFRTAASGIFLHGASLAVVRNCLITDVSCAIICASIPQFRQTLLVDHTTIQNVNGTRSYDWANYSAIICGNDSGNLAVANTIIDGTLSHAIRGTGGAHPWAVTSDYNCFNNVGGLNVYQGVSGTHDLEADPLFADTAAQDFHLPPGSPCIGQASDGLNIGYYPDGLPSIGIHDRRGAMVPAREAVRISPSPFDDQATISTSRGTIVQVTITDLQGRMIRSLEGNGEMVWDGHDRLGRVVPPGIYVCSVTVGPERACVRLIKTGR